MEKNDNFGSVDTSNQASKNPRDMRTESLIFPYDGPLALNAGRDTVLVKLLQRSCDCDCTALLSGIWFDGVVLSL